MDMTPYELSKLFSHRELPGQFLICKEPHLIPLTWNHYYHQEWILGCCPGQIVTPIQDKHNHITGWIIGHAIDIRQEVFVSTANFPQLPHNPTDPFSPLEQYIDELVGRYIVIGFHTSGSSRVYLDSVGAMSAVYSSTEEVVASSTMLIPYQSPNDDHQEHLALISPDTQNRSFHFGLTPRRSIQRLLPNHYLDMQSCSAQRHWPKQPFVANPDINTTLDEIIEILQRCIKVTVGSYSPYLSLTAGKDSRSLLACARPWISKIDTFTWEIPDEMAVEDVNTARQLSRDNDFYHFSIPYHESSEQEKLLWLYRTGCSAGELRGMKIVPSARKLDMKRPHLISLNAEIGRAHLNKPHYKKFQVLTAENIARRVGQLLSEEFLAAAENWLEPLAGFPVGDVLDLAFLEQRLGCWVGVAGYGHAESAFRIPPFSSRKLYETILSLPIDYRQQDRMPEDIIARTWKELLELDFSGK